MTLIEHAAIPYPAPPPVAAARDPYRFQPVFLLATARSFSSVVTAMIGQHPQLAGLPELKLFCAADIAETAFAQWSRLTKSGWSACRPS